MNDRIAHIEDALMDFRKVLIKIASQGNSIVAFLRELEIEKQEAIKDGKDVVIKKTHWYLVEHLGDGRTKLIPEKREGITKCKWLTPSEIVLIMKDSRPLVHYLLEFVLQDPDYKLLRKTRGKIV